MSDEQPRRCYGRGEDQHQEILYTSARGRRNDCPLCGATRLARRLRALLDAERSFAARRESRLATANGRLRDLSVRVQEMSAAWGALAAEHEALLAKHEKREKSGGER